MPKIVSTSNGVVLDSVAFVADVTKLSGGKFARVVSDSAAKQHVQEMAAKQQEEAQLALEKAEQEDLVVQQSEKAEESRAERKARREKQEGVEVL